jgi:ATP-dependent exoDNAse (exonuclease V) beta subunit
VIVDEFQDCNNCQIELLSLLAGPGARGQGGSVDLTVVGDDDQAIYGFRGSDDRTFQRFARGWPGARTIALEENYRSAAEIVGVANSVIARSIGRFAPEKRVRAVSRDAGVAEIVDLTDDANAGEVIAAMLQEMRTSGSGPGWNEVAVLARTHGDLDRIEKALKLEGIPTHRRIEKNVLDEDGVEDVLAWARWLLDPRASWEARRVLSRPPFGVSPAALMEDEVAYKAAMSKAGEERPDPGPFGPWLALRRPESGPIARAAALWTSLREEVAGLRGEEAIWRIMVATDPAHADLLPGRERAARVKALVALLALARDKQPRLSPPGDLGSLLMHLDELRALRDLRLSPGLGDVDEDEGDESGEDEGQGRVQLMTAHAAKGLEFHTVFVPRVCPQHGFPKTTRGDDEWEAPAGLDDRPGSLSTANERLEEERRLFYVACTRAERRLVLMAKKNKRPSTSTHYLEELRGPGGAPALVRTERDVLGAAGKAEPGSGLTRAGEGVGGVTDVDAAIADARGRARAEAAWALERAATDLEGSREGLARAAERFAAIGAMARGERPAAWAVSGDALLRDLARRLSLGIRASGDFAPRAMTPPLRLSYTRVSNYLKCPRCFYLRECMGLPEPSTPSLGLGSLAHDVLAKFFDRVRHADAEGAAPPGAEDLARMGRGAYLASLPEGAPASREDLDVLLAQLRGVLTGLHRPTDHIVEIERAVRVPWVIDGVEHTLEAKIDRLDILPDGGHRIVDYKTSLRPSSKHTKPRADDLQMGVYAIALGHMTGEPVKGLAEYWLLATGQRGSISLEEIDVDGVRAVIEGAARGMLAGEFDREEKCEGPCGLLG